VFYFAPFPDSNPSYAHERMIFLTLRVTVATAERSFLKLKLIKNYLQSTMYKEN
jgi:hypothetical protein